MWCCRAKRIVKIMFRKNYTKWKPLGTMDFGGKEYVTMIRKNKKNGMLQFKTIRINGFFGAMGCVHSFLPRTLIDTQKIWDEVVSE